MNIDRRSVLSGFAAAACALWAGCAGVPLQEGARLAPATLAEAPKLRVALMVGQGAVGACFSWMQLLSFSPQMEVKFVDGRMIREGALADCNVLVCPGGYAPQIRADIGEKGIEEVKKFLRAGGCYFGTCAGAFITLNDANGVGLAPYRQDPKNNNFAHGHAQITMRMTETGAAKMGVPALTRFIWYWNGPLMVPAPIEGVKSEVLATYRGDILMNHPKLLAMADYPAMVGVEYGKGRLLVSSAHPEMSPRTYDLVAGGFKYLTGRKVEFRLPRRERKGLNVGVFTGQMNGVETAKTLMALAVMPGVNLSAVSTWGVRDGAFGGIDVFVVPNGSEKSTMRDLKGIEKDLAAFHAAGGRSFGWAAGARAGKAYGIVDAATPAGLLARIESLAR